MRSVILITCLSFVAHAIYDWPGVLKKQGDDLHDMVVKAAAAVPDDIRAKTMVRSQVRKAADLAKTAAKKASYAQLYGQMADVLSAVGALCIGAAILCPPHLEEYAIPVACAAVMPGVLTGALASFGSANAVVNVEQGIVTLGKAHACVKAIESSDPFSSEQIAKADQAIGEAEDKLHEAKAAAYRLRARPWTGWFPWKGEKELLKEKAAEALKAAEKAPIAILEVENAKLRSRNVEAKLPDTDIDGQNIDAFIPYSGMKEPPRTESTESMSQLYPVKDQLAQRSSHVISVFALILMSFLVGSGVTFAMRNNLLQRRMKCTRGTSAQLEGTEGCYCEEGFSGNEG